MDETVETIERAEPDYVELTTALVAAYVANNHVRPDGITNLIASVHDAFTRLGTPAVLDATEPQKPTPAQIRKSITPDALISFVDGKPYKTLKRHLTGNGMTFEEYRERFGLPRNYPSVAASYSETRSALAKSLGLGQQRRKAAPKAAAIADTVSEKPRRAGRPRKAKDAANA